MSALRPLPEIHLSSLAYTFGHWLPREDHENLDLNASYQRGSVWTTDQQRALIKSLYMGLPIGVIIVSVQPAGSQYHVRVVDGKQRILTIRAFANDELDVPAWWFREEDRDRLNPKAYLYWSELTERCRRRFDMDTSIPALEFKPELEWLGRDADSKSMWHIRTDAEILMAEAELYGLVNGGGTAQTDSDMDRARRVAEGRSCAKKFDVTTGDPKS